jgi:molybdopterin converting factor small subunit
MIVKVRLYATLSRYNPEGKGDQPFTVELQTGLTVNDLLDQLAVPRGEVKQVFIRHKARQLDYQLQDGEQVAVFPPVAGG